MVIVSRRRPPTFKGLGDDKNVPVSAMLACKRKHDSSMVATLRWMFATLAGVRADAGARDFQVALRNAQMPS